MAAATAATANANAAAAAAAAAAGGPAGPPPFALLPGNANALPLDFRKAEDLKFFTKAIEAMTEKFDLKEEKLRTFLILILD